LFSKGGRAWRAFFNRCRGQLASSMRCLRSACFPLSPPLQQGRITWRMQSKDWRTPDVLRVAHLTIVIPHLALLQVILGAAYRHDLAGVLWHILNALVVAVVVMIAAMLVTRQFPAEPSLRFPAVALAIVTGVQVLLGFATFTMLLIGSQNSALLILSVAHVATGALTLAASVLLAIQVRRNLRRV
jgi:hypothetical protein